MLLTEETLANRLDGINMGNDNYNPMLALDVIRKVNTFLSDLVKRTSCIVDYCDSCLNFP